MWNSRQIALIIIFSALTIAIDPLRIPSVYLLGVYYRFSEIPIVATFLLFGPKIGVSVAILNVGAEIILFPSPAGLITPPFVLLLTLSMFLGLHLAHKLFERKASLEVDRGTKQVKYFTLFGTLFRTIIAPLVMFPFYRFILPLVVDLNFSEMQIMAMMPAFMLYALTFSLYTIPIGYLIAKIISKKLKVGNQYYYRF